jgi:hypothetical protein
MQTVVRSTLALAMISMLGCQRSSPVQPEQTNAVAAAPQSSSMNGAQLLFEHGDNTVASVGKPEIDPTWANGTTVYMIGPQMIVNARETMPNAYEHAEELYLLVFPQTSTPQPGAAPITLPSGYQPQCNPCFHPGLPPDFVYHDHVITGAPGMGKNGTAGEYKSPWKIILLVYNPAYVTSPGFAPITSATAVDAAEQSGNVFLPINNAGGNPYEIDTGNLLICPTVSPHA